MIQRNFQNTNEKVSLLGLGCMRFPTKDGVIDREKTLEIIDYAYQHGVNYFDTAMMYLNSSSEAFMGEALSAYPRETFNLATKINSHGLVAQNGDVEGIFADQLKKCRVEYFDYYLLHAVGDENWATFEEHHTYDRVVALQKAGKIRHLGFSFHGSPEFLEKLLTDYRWEFVQIQLNYLDWEKQRAKEQYEIIRKHGLQCVIMEPVRGGALANLGDAANRVLKDARPQDSVASWAIRYAASLDGVLTVLSGMSALAQVQDNVQTLSDFEPISDREKELLAEALHILTEQEWIPCTKCEYCIDCPVQVNIPQVFEVYNGYTKNPSVGGFKKGYREIEENRRADQCIACGACERKCPQHLEIPELLDKIAKFAREYGF